MNDIIEKEDIKIENMIYEIRGVEVMLDSDLAKLYKVETKRINEAVKNNPDKFPERYLFRLSENDFLFLKSKISTSKGGSILKEKLIYPVDFYLKYNGFLGILSINNNELVYGTKSQLEGKFSDYFRNIFNKLFNKKQIAAIKNRLLKNESSMVFEVVDSINDKHIIEYDNDKLVLLDEIYNSIDYSKVDYEELKAFADKNKLEVKELVYTASNLIEFENIFIDIRKENYTYQDKYVEGFVIEDNSGFMFKYKTEYYKKWKLLRSRMENAIKNNDFKAKDNSEVEFMNFLKSKYKDKNIDIGTLSIIDERNFFEKNK